MPLKLNVGVSKKLGLPAYSSVGASCNVEVELDSSMLHDPEGFYAQVRVAYAACRQAVNDELVRLQAQAVAPDAIRASQCSSQEQRDTKNGRGHQNGQSAPANGTADRMDTGARRRAPKTATESQVKAICAIARNQHADLKSLLREEYGVTSADDLSLSQASALIDRLRAACPA
jgi:hypothetical protein